MVLQIACYIAFALTFKQSECLKFRENAKGNLYNIIV